MRGIVSRCIAMLALAGVCFAASPGAAQTEKRVALVIGNGAYQQGPLATAANDVKAKGAAGPGRKRLRSS